MHRFMGETGRSGKHNVACRRLVFRTNFLLTIPPLQMAKDSSIANQKDASLRWGAMRAASDAHNHARRKGARTFRRPKLKWRNLSALQFNANRIKKPRACAPGSCQNANSKNQKISARELWQKQSRMRPARCTPRP